ncbi:MAG: hypothetical protein V4509_03910 [Patescibacteria group bacterium]
MKNTGTKKYWLRGGLLGILFVVLYVVYYLFLSTENVLAFPEWMRIYLMTLEDLFRVKLLQRQDWWGERPNELGSNILFVTQFIVPIVLGVVFGLLYGKTKNRKK